MSAEVEIEFLEWAHPKLGVVKAQVEGGKPLVLKARIKTPQRQWVGLTDEEIETVWDSGVRAFHLLARELETKLKEKNT